MAPPRRPVDERLRLTERDLELLAFAGEHRLVLERQLERFVRTSDGQLRRRLGELAEAGYLRSGCVFGQRHFQITGAGLRASDSGLPVPRFHLGGYKHDVGMAWLWLAARSGRFGPLRQILGERRMRSHDGALEHPLEPYGSRLGGFDRWGAPRLHYPDLLLVDPAGHRLALELELTAKGRARREVILGGYGADRRVDGVLYVVEDHASGRAIGRLVAQSAREMDLADRVAVQLVDPIRLGPGDSAGAQAQRARRVRRSPVRRAAGLAR